MENRSTHHPMQLAGAVLSVAALFFISGCSTTAFSHDLQQRFIGTSATDFFMQHGGPVSSVGEGKEARVYLWFSGRDSAYAPGDRGTVDLIGNTAWWRGYTIANYNPLNECRLQIYAGADGYIYDLRLFGDQRDWQHVHRCREVFWWNL